MVPYVRKSFVKHFKDGLKYIAHDDFEFTFNSEHSIGDESYWTEDGKYTGAYKYAMDMTQRELNQAVEGMYHNLSN